MQLFCLNMRDLKPLIHPFLLDLFPKDRMLIYFWAYRTSDSVHMYCLVATDLWKPQQGALWQRWSRGGWLLLSSSAEPSFLVPYPSTSPAQLPASDKIGLDWSISHHVLQTTLAIQTTWQVFARLHSGRSGVLINAFSCNWNLGLIQNKKAQKSMTYFCCVRL